MATQVLLRDVDAPPAEVLRHVAQNVGQLKRDPKVAPDMIEKFLTRMFPNPDFLFTVNRDFVRSCQTPMLILLDDTPGHPYDVAWETAMLAPKSELAHYPWKNPKELIPIAVRQVRSFLRAHRPQ